MLRLVAAEGIGRFPLHIVLQPDLGTALLQGSREASTLLHSCAVHACTQTAAFESGTELTCSDDQLTCSCSELHGLLWCQT